ncbi:hypothetical protein [Paeniglutamicibacter sp.]|uniref:hypothetical protein n=1 Tax=Paeniglutamicibacter sp. TaxID=1934391 RepID=UPI003989BCBA
MEFALESEAILLKGEPQLPLYVGLFHASYRVESARGEGMVLFGPGAEEGRKTVVTAEDVADLMAATALVPVTAEALRRALVRSVASARYWQEPDGHDVIAGSAPVRAQLVRVANHVAASGHVAGWMSPVDLPRQWRVEWEQNDAPGLWTLSGEPADGVLATWRKAVEVQEARAAVERPADPTAAWGGEWWSMPPARLLHSTGEFEDGSPVGLWCVEDGFGWEKAETRAVAVPGSARIFEVTGASDWAQLCRSYPLEVTAQKRHDWYRTTGRVGRWVMPDFSQMARDHDGVHLSTAAYLSTAGEAIEVDNESASVVAGWNPDESYWFTAEVRLHGDPAAWACTDANSEDAAWSRR